MDLNALAPLPEIPLDGQDNFWAIFDNNPVALIITSFPEGKIVRLNQLAIELLEVSADGVNSSLYDQENIRSDILKVLLACLTKDTQIKDCMLETQSSIGKHLKIIANSSRILINGIQYILIGLVDVTEHIKIQEQTSNVNDELEMVVLRSNELALVAEMHALETEVLRQAAMVVSGAKDVREAIDQILILLNQVVPYQTATVQVQSDERFQRIAGLLSPIILVTGQQSKPTNISMADIPEYQSSLDIPLKIHNQTIGVIRLFSIKPNHFHQHFVDLVSAFADQIALAIETARLFEESQRLAITDPLTGVFNRRHFFQLAEQEFVRANRYGHEFSVIMLDLDHFKRINDTYGHPAGDEVLVSTANFCKKSVRQVDVLARYGGEEFVLLLPETPVGSARIIAERLCTGIAKQSVVYNRQTIIVTASLGVTSLIRDRDQSFDAIVERSDQALYQAKASGRNRFIIFET